jgi:hypothetical protein
MHVVSVFSHYLFSALLIAKMTEIFYHMICYHDYTLRQAQNDRRSIISTNQFQSRWRRRSAVISLTPIPDIWPLSSDPALPLRQQR